MQLQVSAKEELVVTGEAPVVDSTTAEDGVSIREETVQKLASVATIERRRDEPGAAKDLSATQGRALAMTIYGATSVENSYLVDGVNTNNVIYGFQGKVLSQEFIEEIQVKSSGYEAEDGRGHGRRHQRHHQIGWQPVSRRRLWLFDEKVLTAKYRGYRPWSKTRTKPTSPTPERTRPS